MMTMTTSNSIRVKRFERRLPFRGAPDLRLRSGNLVGPVDWQGAKPFVVEPIGRPRSGLISLVELFNGCFVMYCRFFGHGSKNLPCINRVLFGKTTPGKTTNTPFKPRSISIASTRFDKSASGFSPRESPSAPTRSTRTWRACKSARSGGNPKPGSAGPHPLYFPLWASFRSSYVNFKRQEA